MIHPKSLAVAKLTTEHDHGITAPKVSRKAIALEALTTEPDAFQMRVDGIVEPWVVDLLKKINQGNGKLDPLLVWWTGERWVVMDGHHRLEAYRRHAEGKVKYRNIPVTVSKASTPTLALFEANKENAKDKLNTTTEDKYQQAWFFTVEGLKGSKAALYEATGVSVSTIGRMRSRREEMLKIGWGKDGLMDLKWETVKDMARAKTDWIGGIEHEDEALWREGREWAVRLRDTFGKKLSDAPEIASIMLLAYSENTTRRILESRFLWKMREEIEAADLLDEEDEGEEPQTIPEKLPF